MIHLNARVLFAYHIMSTMRYFSFVVIMLGVGALTLFSCAKWKDPAPITDPRLTNPYCNDPDAVNYNRGFPGKPDNSICFYPTDLFKGVYLFKDSVYRDTLFISADSFYLTIEPQQNSHTKMLVSGMCRGGDPLIMTAGASFIATLDTTIGDTTTLNLGQFLCRSADTIAGTITKPVTDTNIQFPTLLINFKVASDTGVTTHIGKAKKQ